MPAKAGDPVPPALSTESLAVSEILDQPPEPVIGRRFAPTRWRVMTAALGLLPHSPAAPLPLALPPAPSRDRRAPDPARSRRQPTAQAGSRGLRRRRYRV